jgi:exodeoxyribonuclease V alpha subunit
MTGPNRPRQGAIFDFADGGARGRQGQNAPTAATTGERVAWQGAIERFVYRNAENGFGVALYRRDDGIAATIKGPLWGIEIGAAVAIDGVVEEDPRHGRQVRVLSARPILPDSREGVLRYLKSGKIAGIGPTIAERLLDHLGEDPLGQIRDNPDALNGVKGLAKKARAALVEQVQVHAEAAANAVFLYGLGLGPLLTARIEQRYGKDTVRQVRERPYRLAEDVQGIGFKTADRLARELGVPETSPDRMRAGLLHALQELAQQGHTAPPESLVLETAAAILEVAPDALDEAVALAVAQGACVRADGALCLADLAHAEARIALRMATLLGEQSTQLLDMPARIAEAEIALGFALEGGQRDAVMRTLETGVLVVTGGPGTGKTTIIRGVLAAMARDKPRLALAAPTGRAARRLAEATGAEAKTLHRLLEFDPRTGRFLRNLETPLDADLIIVDEVSMMEAQLAAALLDATPLGARLLLVGDADQLPSVGPGAVLDDLIQSQCIPVVALNRIYRQGEGSQIALNAHRVRMGQLPQSSPRHADGDFYLVPREQPEDILAGVLEIVQHRLPQRGFEPIRDIQVLAPVHRGPLGTQALNEALRHALNPHGEQLSHGLRVGDKVQQLKNDYDLEVFNGDIGVVVGRGDGKSDNRQPGLALSAAIKIRFGERLVEVEGSALDNLQLAYAVTVHKSQGSEYPAVVLPLHPAHHMMLQRNLLYTALTRGRRFVVLVGPTRAIERAVQNDAPIHRHTQLRQALQRAMQKE